MKLKQHFKTIVISDLHLGSSGSKAKEVVKFLSHITCDKLILNGDIIDGWQLKRSGVWRKRHTKFFRILIKLMEKHGTTVVYLRGNHDDFLDQVIPFTIGKLTIQKEYIHNSNDKRYLVVHGDVFDSVTSHLRWVSHLGDIGYTFLLWINKLYNQYRTSRGLPYYSLSKKIKSKVKAAVSYISKYEQELVALARNRECNGVICGHIHQPAILKFEEIEYLNSGDWVETLSALTEDYEGKWNICYYTDFIDDLKVLKEQKQSINYPKIEMAS